MGEGEVNVTSETAALICAFHVAGSIVPWGRSRTKAGRHFTDKRVSSYQGAIRDAAYVAMEGRPPYDGPCRVRIEAHFAVPASWSKRRKAAALYHSGRPDADNILKQLDAINGIVFTDDARICDARVVKTYSDRPGLLVTVWEA